MAKVKICKHCGGIEFVGYITKGAQMKFDGTADEPVVVKEAGKTSYQVSTCIGCRQKITNADLVDADVCTECGKAVAETDITDGICITCEAAKSRPDLLNLSQADLIKMIIQMEKGGAKKAAKIETTVAKAEETQKAAADKATAKATKAATVATTDVAKAVVDASVPDEAKDLAASAADDIINSLTTETPKATAQAAAIAKVEEAVVDTAVNTAPPPAIDDEDPF